MEMDYDVQMANNIIGMSQTNQLIEDNNETRGRYTTTLEQNKSAFASTAGGINGISSSLITLGIVNDDQTEILKNLTTAMMLTSSILALYQAYRLTIDLYNSREAILASIETAAAVAAQNYLGIAVAASAAIAVPVAFYAGYTQGRKQTKNIKETDLSTPAGRRYIAAEVRRASNGG